MTEAQQIQMLKKHSKTIAKNFEKARKLLREEVSGHMHLIIPAAKMPLAQIVHNVVTDQDVALPNLQAAIHGRPDMTCHAGTYTVLHTRDTPEDGWKLMMSDTPYEMRAARSFKYVAHGKVLVVGLGLGATTIPVLQKEEVESVTVIEANPHVVDLVGTKLKEFPWGKKLDIVLDDGFLWKPPKGAKFNTIWLDIWPDICGDNLPGITKLKRRYSRWLDRTDERCWMGVWEEAHLRREARRDGQL